MQRPKFKPKKLAVGAVYTLSWVGSAKTFRCKLIQATRCGYNFLNLDNHQTVLRSHLYPSKYENHKNGTWFFISERLRVEDGYQYDDKSLQRAADNATYKKMWSILEDIIDGKVIVERDFQFFKNNLKKIKKYYSKNSEYWENISIDKNGDINLK